MFEDLGCQVVDADEIAREGKVKPKDDRKLSHLCLKKLTRVGKIFAQPSYQLCIHCATPILFTLAVYERG